uniref:Uncharacterized protein n=1 Tax=Pavo cristatus TaxID=9049 RepID=A0A8C9ER67_PAVCR
MRQLFHALEVEVFIAVRRLRFLLDLLLLEEVPRLRFCDEIMHQDIIPLYAADIHDQLKKQFAYLSGGRGGDGCPVITFPDYPAFNEIPEKEFQNVLTYLTSIPSIQEVEVVTSYKGQIRKHCSNT